MHSSNQRHSLKAQGYAVVQNYLSRPLLDTLRRQRDQVLAELSPEHRKMYESQGSLINLGDHCEFSHLIGLGELHSLIETLGSDDIRWLAGYLISKPPKSPPLFWHQDWWGWDHPISYSSRLSGLGLMIYLSDTCTANGCLRVIPGSHRYRHPLHNLPVAHEKELSMVRDPDNIAYLSDSSEAAVEVKAGDVVLIDPRLLHSAYANQTDNERSLITLWYLPDFGSLPESIQARYVRIFNRQDLDTGDSAAGQLLDSWPPKNRRVVEHLEPKYEGSAEPHPWNRAPDQSRMLAFGTCIRTV